MPKWAGVTLSIVGACGGLLAVLSILGVLTPGQARDRIANNKEAIIALQHDVAPMAELRAQMVELSRDLGRTTKEVALLREDNRHLRELLERVERRLQE